MKKYWKNIRKKYPKAFDKLCKNHATIKAWGYIDHPDIWGEFINEPPYVLRHLYDFFDSKKIYGFCTNRTYEDWIFYCSGYGITDKIFNSREQAELELYEKMFDVLENLIGNRKK